VDDGIVNPVKGLPSVRFNIEHIMKLEETEISKLSPLERKRLLKEIEQLKKEKEELQKQNEELKDFVRLTVGNGIKFVKEVI
jgi:cell shape-determining protein MreC